MLAHWRSLKYSWRSRPTTLHTTWPSELLLLFLFLPLVSFFLLLLLLLLLLLNPCHFRLKEVIAHFVKLCQFALVLNKTLIQPEQEEFQVQLEAGYETLKRELQV